MTNIIPIFQDIHYRAQSVLPRLYPSALCRLEDVRSVAVTIDDGPSSATPRLLDMLDESGMSATFFLSGDAVERFPAQARAIRDRGHALASHGFAHVGLLRKSRSEVEADTLRGLAVIERTTGLRPAFYRPPYGRLHPLHRGLPAALGCTLVLWSMMPGDFNPRLSLPLLLARMSHVKGGDIIVLHDRADTAGRASACLGRLGDALHGTGLRTITL